VGSIPVGSSTSVKTGSVGKVSAPPAQLPAVSHSRHVICTTPSPGWLNHVVVAQVEIESKTSKQLLLFQFHRSDPGTSKWWVPSDQPEPPYHVAGTGMVIMTGAGAVNASALPLVLLPVLVSQLVGVWPVWQKSHSQQAHKPRSERDLPAG
jgi:hypothetical protein